ncbi:MAG: hypothetical protein ABI553_08890, partial [Chloroflexota bacterium]
MDSRNAASETQRPSGSAHPDAVEFVRFCYRRRRVGWPELYDEMCAVAGRGLFRGYDADDLAGLGIGFSLFDMPALAVLSSRIVAEELALRRPVVVTIRAEMAGTAEPQLETAPTAAPVPSNLRPSTDSRDERTFDVPIRL